VIAAGGGNTFAVGITLFTKYLWPFELASILILLAMIAIPAPLLHSKSPRETFFLDTSGLAESAFTRRTKTREGAGGPGNTGGFSSFAVSLDGGGFPALAGLRYHAAYVHQDNDTADAEDETRLAFAAEWAIAVNDKIAVTPLVEYVRFDDADGTLDQDRWYFTAGVGITYGR